MKKISVLFITLLILISLSACGRASFNGSRTGNDSQLIMDYKIFNTTEEQFLTLEQGDTLDVQVVSNSGKLDIAVGIEEETPIYTGEDVPTSSFKLEISQEGIYKVSVIGHKAKGSVSIIKEDKTN
jgi:hypothetical protein